MSIAQKCTRSNCAQVLIIEVVAIITERVKKLSLPGGELGILCALVYFLVQSSAIDHSATSPPSHFDLL